MSGSALGEDTSARDLEEEAGQEGAFNPETGEINWDCPCLGGMAHGPWYASSGVYVVSWANQTCL